MQPDPPVWRPTAVLVTCEHAGNEVPPAYAPWFADAGGALASHRGWDIGSLGYGMRLASRLSAPLIHTTVTRLLIEPNRSPDHPGLYSEFSRDRAPELRRAVFQAFYAPHRRSVESIIGALVQRGDRVLHLGAHSFTDVLDGNRRDMDIGLLFDPGRASEAAVCRAWGASLGLRAPDRVTRFNEPYLGTDDGLTTHLRTVFSADRYAGVEIEIRQGLIGHADEQRAMGDLLADTLPGCADGQTG